MVVSLWLLLIWNPLRGQDGEAHRWPVKVLQRLLAPFRSNPFSQSSVGPCDLGLATCFSPASNAVSRGDSEGGFTAKGLDPPVTLELRSDRGGPFAHHWLELDGPNGRMTIGFGPATLPFIDSGQVSVQDRYGNIKRISGMHPLPWLALPPIKYHYARSPGEGHMIGKPIPITTAQAEGLTRKVEHQRFVGPYIPIFHDCRTYVCAMLASTQGRSTLPCYLLFKGYW